MKMPTYLWIALVLALCALFWSGCKASAPGAPPSPGQTALTNLVDQVLPIVANLGLAAAQSYLQAQVGAGALDPALATAVDTALVSVGQSLVTSAGGLLKSPPAAAWREPSTREAVLQAAAANLKGSPPVK